MENNNANQAYEIPDLDEETAIARWESYNANQASKAPNIEEETANTLLSLHESAQPMPDIAGADPDLQVDPNLVLTPPTSNRPQYQWTGDGWRPL